MIIAVSLIRCRVLLGVEAPGCKCWNDTFLALCSAAPVIMAASCCSSVGCDLSLGAVPPPLFKLLISRFRHCCFLMTHGLARGHQEYIFDVFSFISCTTVRLFYRACPCIGPSIKRATMKEYCVSHRVQNYNKRWGNIGLQHSVQGDVFLNTWSTVAFPHMNFGKIWNHPSQQYSTIEHHHLNYLHTKKSHTHTHTLTLINVYLSFTSVP